MFLYELILNNVKLRINEIFDEIDDQFRVKFIEREWADQMDFVLGFI